jgi:hypothetical protein
VPSIRVYRQTGINPFRFTTNHNKAHDFIGAKMKVFILLLLIIVIVYSVSPNLYNYFAPFHYLDTMELWTSVKFLPRQVSILIMNNKSLSQDLINKLDKDMQTHSFDERIYLIDWLMANQLTKDKKQLR